ncbi:MarR family winged helix-turn-helix transcriptional regulator [Reyranella sp. CPCC 100927]|uniref:MarR family winged helix-turn-helix transcriptional regulator n=1 Tax=Reyranella sp. CPCC 100927 TaxID=2599616 RepID=UPI0011B64B6C|nr:MarR family transcriptional regulator [Reyranella sp. CPCC 100927]TWT03138.1 MarR family transcriptional regulator [Reyranella sp. CPCC 100927]
MARATSAAKAEDIPPTTIRELLSYRVGRTANAMSHSAALRFQRFNVTLQEWRTLALLAADAPQSLNRLARSAGLDKAQMSRAVSSLVKRGLVIRKPSPAGGRAVDLTLSRRGAALYRDLMADAQERDDAFRACLSPEESRIFEAALRKLYTVGRALSQAAAAGMAATGPRGRRVRE